MKKTAEIVIIGGGIIGASIAYHLAAKRVRGVVLLEKGLLGEGSTAKCAGGIRTQFSTEINIRFSLESLKTWERFQEITGVDLGFKRVGYLFLAATERDWKVLQESADLQRRLGVPVELLLPEEIRYRWPFIYTDDLRGGTYCPWDGYAGPYEALTGFIQGARRGGVEILERTEVLTLLRRGDRVLGVQTDKGEIAAPIVVNAAGPWAGEVGQRAQAPVPVKPFRRQLFFTAPFPYLPESIPLIIDYRRGWYCRREGSGLLLSGPKDDFPSFSQQVDYEAMAEAAEAAVYRIPILEKAAIVRGWAGSYEISPDHHAILGEHPELKGFFLANGLSGHGFQHSPAVGKVMAERILGETPSLDLSSLSLRRFVEGTPIHEPLTAFRD
jgi:sarcosine oxidase subunit beta